MAEVGQTVKRWRKEPALAMADQLAELSRLIPPELISAVAQASDLTASNVPGVPVPVWLAGARVSRMYPLVATIGAAVNVTMLLVPYPHRHTNRREDAFFLFWQTGHVCLYTIPRFHASECRVGPAYN